MEKLKVVLKNQLAQLPTRAHQTDAGLDLYSCEPCVLAPGETKLIDTGISIDFQGKYVAKVESRSGMASRGLFVTGGIIDQGYTGNIKVILNNFSQDDVYLQTGSKIAQLVMYNIALPIVELTAELLPSDRSSSGFGSTGQ